MQDLSLFFSGIDREPYKTLFSGADQVWGPLKNLDSILQSLMQSKTDSYSTELEGVCFDKSENGLFKILIPEWLKI